MYIFFGEKVKVSPKAGFGESSSDLESSESLRKQESCSLQTAVLPFPFHTGVESSFRLISFFPLLASCGKEMSHGEENEPDCGENLVRRARKRRLLYLEETDIASSRTRVPTK